MLENKKRNVVLIGIAGFLAAAVAVFYYLSRDEHTPDDRDLALSRVEISPTENVLYHFVPYYDPYSKEIILEYWPEAEAKAKESKEIYWPADTIGNLDAMVFGKEWDEDLVKDVLERNNEFFEDFEKGFQYSYYQDPTVQDPATVDLYIPLISMGEYKSFARLNLLRATYLFKQGAEKEAFDETIKVMKMGQMFHDSPLPHMIQYLTGIAVKGMGLEHLRTMVKETDLSPELLKHYIEELDQFYANKEGLTKILKGEYTAFMNFKSTVIDSIAQGKKLSEEKILLAKDITPGWLRPISRMSYFYKPNQTQRIFAEGFREKVEVAEEGLCQERGATGERLLVPSSRLRLLFTENLIGKILHDIVIISSGGIFERRCMEEFSISGTKLLMAIKAYKIENGELPSNLEELIPEYISEIPKDPFDGSPIRYSQGKKIIYSVGSDLIDSGGSEGENWTEMPDPTFKVEF